MSTEQPSVPYGCCQCGCGRKTTVPTETSRSNGRIKGVPMKFIRGHAGRRSPVEYKVEAATECWTWQLYKTREGYGTCVDGGKRRKAHRVYYERKFGPIPEGLVVHHTCHNASCVNPEHMELMTPSEHSHHHNVLQRLLASPSQSLLEMLERAVIWAQS